VSHLRHRERSAAIQGPPPLVRPGLKLRLENKEAMIMARKIERIVENGFVAEIEIETEAAAGDFAPAVSLADARKLEAARRALKAGDTAAAAKFGRIFRMLPVSA